MKIKNMQRSIILVLIALSMVVMGSFSALAQNGEPITEPTTGLAVSVIFFIAAIVTIVILAITEMEKKSVNKGIAAVVIFFVLGIVFTPGVLTRPAEVEPLPPGVVITPLGFQVGVSESLSHVTAVSGAVFEFIVEMAMNDTAAAFTGQTQFFEATFTVNGLAGKTTTATTVTVPRVESQTAVWDSRDFVEKNPDGTFAIEWTDSASGSVNKQITLPRLTDMNTDTVTVNITADDVTVAGMAENDKATVVINVAGQDVRIIFEKETVTTWP